MTVPLCPKSDTPHGTSIIPIMATFQLDCCVSLFFQSNVWELTQLGVGSHEMNIAFMKTDTILVFFSTKIQPKNNKTVV